MRTVPAALIALGLAAALLWAVMALGGAQVMPSYLAAWLFWLAIPVGALALVMALEFAGEGISPIAAGLRPLLILLPFAALLAILVLVRLDALYAWSRAAPQEGLAPTWFSSGFFVVRSVVYLVVWSVLALVFIQPPPTRLAGRGRSGLAGLGLILHLVIGSLAATDWAMSLDLGLGSSCFGLLMIAAQCSLALAAAILVIPALRDPALLPKLAGLMLALLGMWMFLHITQFLIVWSANLPKEIVWYQRRDGGLGGAAEWLGLAAMVLALIVLLPGSRIRTPGVVAALAGLVVFTHLVEMLWLVTPTYRGAFTISVADVLALAGVGGLAFAAARMLPLTWAPRARRVGHGRA